jgi:hypothetical protein
MSNIHLIIDQGHHHQVVNLQDLVVKELVIETVQQAIDASVADPNDADAKVVCECWDELYHQSNKYRGRTNPINEIVNGIESILRR